MHGAYVMLTLWICSLILSIALPLYLYREPKSRETQSEGTSQGV